MKHQRDGDSRTFRTVPGSAKSLRSDPEERCRNLIQNLPQAVFETDRDGCWSFLNKGWRLLSGFDVDQCIGASYHNYVHPQDRVRCKEVFSKMQHSTTDHCTEAFRFLIKSGSYLWMEVHAAPVRTPERGFTGIVGTLINITDRVSEEELLLADQRTLTAMLNDLPGMVYRCRNNPDWSMEYVSGSSYELTGYYPQDIVTNKKLSYGSMIHPDDKQGVWNEVQNGVREDRRFELEYRIITATGEEKWVWERGKGIFSNNDELLGLEGFITDITERRSIEKNKKFRALYDEITGLPTQQLFKDRIDIAIQRATVTNFSFALFVVHLDRVLKDLQQLDTESAESVTREVGHRLQAICSPIDSITRLDHERWGILIENPGVEQSVKVFSQQLQDVFLAPVKVGTMTLYVTASIGVALGEGLQRNTDGRNADDLLRDATHAMHCAHSLGGGHCEIFDSRIHRQAIAWP